MKTKLLLLGVLAAISSGAQASSYDDEQGYTMQKRQEMMAVCGDFRDVGYSSVFGSPEEYMRGYSELGFFSAKLDRVSRIDSGVMGQVNVMFQDALNLQGDFYKNMDRNDEIMSKYSGMLSQNNETLNYHQDLVDENRAETEQYINYNTEKTINDVTTLLQTPINGSSFSSGNVEDQGWSDYMACLDWWEYQYSNREVY